MSGIEIERKYIIKKPDEDMLRELSGFSESDIVQIYIESPDNITHRVRKRTYQGSVTYTETKKTRIDKMSAAEDEREISENEFEVLAQRIKPGTKAVLKTRYTFVYFGQLFEIDVYPQWQKSCILETELTSRDEKVKFPEFIEILEEVTGNRAYSNASMSRSMPSEKDIK